MILVAAKRLWGHSKNMFILHAGCLWIFEWKIEEWKERKELFFCKLNIKDGNVFYTDIYTITTIKIFTCSYIKKSLKKCLRRFNETFSNYQATYQKKLYLLFEKSANFFHRVSTEIGLTLPSLPPVCFHSLFKDLPLPVHNKSFLKSVHWKRWKELMIMLVHSCI